MPEFFHIFATVPPSTTLFNGVNPVLCTVLYTIYKYSQQINKKMWTLFDAIINAFNICLDIKTIILSNINASKLLVILC